LVAASTPRTSSSPIPYRLSASGFTSTRTAGNAPPPTITCPTPGTCESFCCRMLDAASYIRPRPSVVEVNARMRIGASAGLTLRYVGLLGSVGGR
jgi:hypothetical protein